MKMDRQLVYLIAFVLLTALTIVNLLRYRREKAGENRGLYWFAVVLWVAYALIYFFILC